MRAKDTLPYGIGMLLALAGLVAYLWWTEPDEDSAPDPGTQTLPDVYNVL